MMSKEIEIVEKYFSAWNAHDTDAILATFTIDGTYSDPVGGKNLSGQNYADYASSLFITFPDLKLELIENSVASTGVIAAPWLLFGTHQGPVGELQATGKSIVLPGCDFITVENEKIKQVIGYFDPEYLFEQLSP